jgi:integrase
VTDTAHLQQCCHRSTRDRFSEGLIDSCFDSFCLLNFRNAIDSHLRSFGAMAGRQAKVLSEQDVEDLLFFASTTRNPDRNRVIVLLSTKAGLRAAEIANLTWDMITDAVGDVGTRIELRDQAAKRGNGRIIPMHIALRDALIVLHRKKSPRAPVISARGKRLRPLTIVIWFARAYHAIGLDGCSSHSGRRTFITKAARAVSRTGGSLRDVQLLAGHRSIETTQRYIDGDTDAQRRLVSLI